MAKKSKNKGAVRLTLRYYWRELRKYWWMALIGVVTTILIVFIQSILAPLIFADLIDKAASGLSGGALLEVAAWEVIGFLILFLISRLVIDPLRLWVSWKMELRVIMDFSTECFDTITAQSMQFHNDRFAGSLVSQTNKFVWSFERFYDTFVWDLLPMASGLTMTVIVLAQRVPWFTVGLVAFVILYGVFAFRSFRKIAPLNEIEAEAENRRTGQLADSITNMTSVKSYAREGHERQRYLNFLHKSYDASFNLLKASTKRGMQFGVVQLGLSALILIFLVFGREWLGISVATLVLIVNYSQEVAGELWSFNHIFKNMNQAFGDAREMTLILDMPDDVVDEPGAKPLKMQEASVDFDHISFQHSDAKEAIFTDFSLEIKPGERVGLVGVSGSGKTTLTKLLLRFADVDAGEILVSGQNIREVTQRSLRSVISYVPQETSLFHRSIGENIAYGKPGASNEEIRRAAELANADEFIEKLPQGYNTLVGERGIKLSGGQRQRIAIARAILKDAPILVLDEATSALDSESEALIQSALGRLMAGRTSIVIAHRLSTVANLDRIIVLQDGKIVEQGTHKELIMRPKGVYHHLWDRQSGAFIEES